MALVEVLEVHVVLVLVPVEVRAALVAIRLLPVAELRRLLRQILGQAQQVPEPVLPRSLRGLVRLPRPPLLDRLLRRSLQRPIQRQVDDVTQREWLLPILSADLVDREGGCGFLPGMSIILLVVDGKQNGFD